MLKFTTAAHIVNGNTVALVEADLTGLAPGNYLIGFRRPPWDWTFCPLSVK